MYCVWDDGVGGAAARSRARVRAGVRVAVDVDVDWSTLMRRYQTCVDDVTRQRRHGAFQQRYPKLETETRKRKQTQPYVLPASHAHTIPALSADVFSGFALRDKHTSHERDVHVAYMHLCTHVIPALARLLCARRIHHATTHRITPASLVPRREDGHVDVATLMHRIGINMRLLPLLHAHLHATSPLRDVLLHEMMCRTIKCRYRRYLAHLHSTSTHTSTASHISTSPQQQQHASLSIHAADEIASTLLVHMLRQLFSPHHSDADADMHIMSLWREAQLKYAHHPDAMTRRTAPDVDTPICAVTRTMWCDAFTQLRRDIAAADPTSPSHRSSWLSWLPCHTPVSSLTHTSHRLIRTLCITLHIRHTCVTQHAVAMDAAMPWKTPRVQHAQADHTSAMVQLMHAHADASSTHVNETSLSAEAATSSSLTRTSLRVVSRLPRSASHLSLIHI